MRKQKKKWTASLLIAGTSLSALCMAAPAVAQQSDPVTLTAETEDDQSVQKTVVITGSRIATDSALTAPSPVQTVTIDNFINSGDIDISNSLRNIPALQGSDPATLDSAAGAAATGASTLNLRGLGTDRTLVLQDGRRHVPGIAGTATVDVGSIPQALIARTEILTGGASSVYGADAVSGVVNFITRTGRDFDGIEYRLQTGISSEGDAEEVLLSLAGGRTFDNDRASVVFALEASHSEDIVNADRPGIAGPGFSSLNGGSPLLNSILGLDPNAENIFVPNRTLPVSSAGSTIAIDPFGFAFPFGALNSFVGDFNPLTDTIPTIDGTNIPVLQVIDPVTGELRAFNPGFSSGAFNAIGGDGIPIGETAGGLTLIPEITKYTATLGGDYNVNEFITVYADGKYTRTQSSATGGIPFSDDILLANDNPFLPAELVAQIAELDALVPGFTPNINVARDNLGDEIGGGNATDRDTLRFSGGVRGKIPGLGFDYDASYTWGRTEIENVNTGSRLNDRYFTAIDAVALTAADLDGTNPNLAFGAGGVGTLNAIRNGEDLVIDAGSAQIGDIVCRSELTGLPSPGALFVGGPPLFAAGSTINGTDVSSLTRPVTFAIGDGQCAPINILGINSIGGAGAAFAFQDLLETTDIEQQQVLITVSGDSSQFFELPAGPIGFAAGFEWRDDSSQFTPNVFASIEGLVIGNATVPEFASPTDGQDIRVFEGFGEIRIPLLKDLPFAEYLEVTAAGRISDYNTIGGTETFSFGGRYQPHDWVTVRGTYARAIRAPNIGELFGPQQAAFIGVDADPCDNDNITEGSANRAANCLQFVADGFDSSDFLTAFVTGTTGGNPLLIEETSDSFTAGAVFQPGGILEGLVLVADYYDIEIDNAVGSLTGAAIAGACVDLPSTDNQFCDAIVRDPNNGGAISTFTSGNINLSFLRARGVDFDARYSFDLPGELGSVQTSVVGTRFIERFTESDPVIAQTIADEPDPLQQALLIADQATVSDLLGVIGTPEWIFNVGVNWEVGKWNFGATGRFEDSSSFFSNAAQTDVTIVGGDIVVSDNAGLADPSQLSTGSSFEIDVSVNYEHSDRLGVYGGISNLTGREPFLGSLIRPVGPRGPFFFMGVRGTF